MNSESGIASRPQLACPLALSSSIAAFLVIAAAPGIVVASLYHETFATIAPRPTVTRPS